MNLLAKEILEHGKVLLLLALASAVSVWILVAAFSMSTSSLSVIEVARSYIGSIMPIIALVLGHRLIVQEYMSGTLLYAESLPVSRAAIFTGKYLFGLIYLVVISLSVLATILLLADATDNINQKFVQILGLKVAATSLFTWSLVFLLSFLGGLRVPLCFLLFLLIYLVHLHTSVDVSRLGPAGLIDSEFFAFESTHWPWKNVFESVGCSVIFVLLGFTLANYKEGKIAWGLARGMGRREYVLITVLLLCALTLVQLLDDKPQVAPIQFSGASSVTHQTLPISVQFTEASLESTAQQTLDSLSAMQTALLRRVYPTTAADQLPAIRLSLEIPAVDPVSPSEAANIRIEKMAGVLVRTSYDTTLAQHRLRILATVLRESFLVSSNGRADFELNGWLLDGFSWWWALRGAVQENGQHLSSPYRGKNSAAMAHKLAALASHLAPILPAASHFENWSATRERYGVMGAAALGYSLVDTLVNQFGEELVFDLVRQRLIKYQADDSRVTFNAQFNLLTDQLAKAANTPWLDIVRLWKVTLDSQQLDSNNQQIGLKSVAAAWQLAADKRRSEKKPDHNNESLAAFVVLADSILEQAAFQNVQCLMLHKPITAYDQIADADQLEEYRFNCSDGFPGNRLMSLYGGADRVFVALEVNLEPQHYPHRLAVGRVVVP